VNAPQRLALDGLELRVHAASLKGEALAAFARQAAAAALDQRVLAHLAQCGDETLWLKGDHLPGKARWRHTFGGLFGRATPREREHRQLDWLRARLFRAPRPRASASIRSRGVLRYHVLALDPLGAHEALGDAWPRASEAERCAWIDELAHESARLHSLHFVHRNLFLRNLLVDRERQPDSGDPRRLIFIDPWRGGAPLPLRGCSYDLACLMFDAAGLWSSAHQRRFFACYAEERARQAQPVELRDLLARADERRRALARRSRGPQSEWNWRALVD
jgi:hypothetical protein